MKRIIKSWWNGFKTTASWYAQQYTKLYSMPMV